MHYWIDASQDGSGDYAHSGSQAGPGNVVAVVDQLRFTLQQSNGSPAANLPVYWRMDDLAEAGKLTTDANGRVTLSLSGTDSGITTRAANQKYADIFFSVFDNWPTSTITSSTTRTGNGIEIAAVLNLGLPTAPAVDALVQDKVFTLAAMTRDFVPAPATNDPFCTPYLFGYDCVYSNPDITQGIFFTGDNIGGGRDFSACWAFTDSTYMRSAFLYQTSAGGWAESKGESLSTQTSTASLNCGSSPIGPLANKTGQLKWFYSDSEEHFCPYSSPGSQSVFSCVIDRKVVPKLWSGGLMAPLYSVTSSDDTMNTAVDCYAEVAQGGDFVSSNAVGSDRSHSMTIGGNAHIFHATVSWSRTTGSVGEHSMTWHAGSGYIHHEVFVQLGGTTICPGQHPELTWTNVP